MFTVLARLPVKGGLRWSPQGVAASAVLDQIDIGPDVAPEAKATPAVIPAATLPPGASETGTGPVVCSAPGSGAGRGGTARLVTPPGQP